MADVDPGIYIAVSFIRHGTCSVFGGEYRSRTGTISGA